MNAQTHNQSQSPLEAVFLRLTEEKRRELREEYNWESEQEYKVKTVPDDLTEDELREREELQKQWQALTARGLDEKWLYKQNYQYSVSTAFRSPSIVPNHITKHPTRLVEVRETDKEREKRLKALHKKIETKVRHQVRRQMESIKEAQSVLSGSEMALRIVAAGESS